MNSPTGSPLAGTPAAEVEIDTTLITRLLEDQHPDLAHLPLRATDSGWDNAIFRLGERLAVRLPRRAAAAPLILHEQTWLPGLQARLTLPAPIPCRVGTPAHGFPWWWSVIPWLSGTAADLDAPHASQAHPFAAFLRSLHVPAPVDASVNPVRGVPLIQRASAMETRLQQLDGRTDLITPEILALWQTALHAPIDVPSTWLHGDLHPRNILVDNGVLTGIIDWGDMTSGDRATDLASIFMLFAEPNARREALFAYGEISEATLQRAKGWAVLFGVMLLASGMVDNPRHAVIGERTLRCVAEPS